MEAGNPRKWTHVDAYDTTITVTDETVTWEAREIETSKVLDGGACPLEKWATEGFADIVNDFGVHGAGLEVDIARRVSRRSAASAASAAAAEAELAAGAKRAAEEAERAAAGAEQAAEASRAAEEAARAAEAQRVSAAAAETERVAEAERAAEAKRVAEEAARVAEEATRAAEEARRAAGDAAAEAERAGEARHAAEEGERAAEAGRASAAAAEAERAAEAKRAAAEAEGAAAEAKRAAEAAERTAEAAARAAEEAERAAAAAPTPPPSRVPIADAGGTPDIFTDDEWKDLKTLPFHLFTLVATADGNVTLAEECALLEPWTTKGEKARPLVAQLYGSLARERSTVWLLERATNPDVTATLEQRCIAALKRLPAKEYESFVLAMLAGAVRVARTNEGPLTTERRVLQEIADRFGVDLRLAMPD